MGGEQPRQPVDEELDPGGQLAAMGIEGVDGERRRLPLGQDAHQLAPASRGFDPTRGIWMMPSPASAAAR